ncbi:MAG: hypothetical protein NVSMB46_08460 [Candidatus Saccharimonadales bacterium]
MNLTIIYHPQSEFARSVEEFEHDMKNRTAAKIELVSLETKEGAAVASLYDIMQYPAILALRDDRQLVKSWQGPILPLLDEVRGYLNA